MLIAQNETENLNTAEKSERFYRFMLFYNMFFDFF